MKYNKAKRTLSVISSILGLLITVGVVAAVALGIVDLVGSNNKFAIGDSLSKLANVNLTSDVVKWIIYVVVFVLAYVNVMIIIGLLKKPMLINDKFKSVGWRKFFFAILTIVFGAVIALQFFSTDIQNEENLKLFIALGVAVVVALLQIISMFLSTRSKKEIKDAEKEVPELVEEPKQEENKEEVVVNAPENAVAVKGMEQLSVFNTIANDPVADGFEQRIREIRHLREAGLINDTQTAAAVEKIIYGFTKSTK